MRYPALIYDRKALLGNINRLADLCHDNGVRMALVTKVVCADPRLMNTVENSRADLVADSRIQNLKRIRTKREKLLLRIPMLSEAREAAAYADCCLVSEIAVVKALGAEARKQSKTLGVLLMVDLGDLREGVYYRNESLILETARAVTQSPFLRLEGIGTNLTCFGGILPDEENMGALCRVAQNLERALHIPIRIISGGNSSALQMLQAKRLPPRINQLRLGESVFLGYETAFGTLFPGLNDRVCILRGEIVEVQDKPATPHGTPGRNAFGEKVESTGLDGCNGVMRRGILALGRQDVDEKGLTCTDPRIRILGASSDHLIVDFGGAKKYRVGDRLDFVPSYGALLRAATSPYVHKYYR